MQQSWGQGRDLEKGLVTPVTAHRRVSTSVVLGRGAGSWGADPSTSPHTTPSSAHQGLASGGADAAAPSEGGKSGSCSLGGLDVQHEEDGQSLAPGSGHPGSPLPGLQGRGTEGAGDATRGTGRSGCAGRPPAAQNEAAVRWEGGPRLPSVTGRPAAARVGTVRCHLAPCVPQGDLARGLVAFWGRGVLCPGGAGAGGAGRPERERVPAGVTRLTAGFSIPCP